MAVWHRKLFAFIGTAGLTAAALVTGASPASAITPTAACGPGFGVVDSLPVLTISNVSWGTVYLLYNAGTGDNCVVTIKSRFVGTPTYTYAALQKRVKGNTITLTYKEGGAFKSYAGGLPKNLTTAYAKDICVRFDGRIEDTAIPTGLYAEGRVAIAHSGWGHCKS